MDGRTRGAEIRTAPAYQTLRDQLRGEIAAGHYRDGARLPTESELVARHGLSRQTVRRAFQDLVAEGVVYRVPGRGTYASEPGRRYLRQLGSIEDLMSLSDDTTMEVLAGLRRRVDVDAASRLRLDDDVVYSVVFRRLHDGVPFVSTTVHLVPWAAQPVLASSALADGAVGTHTVIGLLEPHLAEPIAEAAQSITVAPADDLVADAVGCRPGHPMLRVDRLYSDVERQARRAVGQSLPARAVHLQGDAAQVWLSGRIEAAGPLAHVPEVVGLRRCQRRAVQVLQVGPDRDVVGQHPLGRAQPVVVVEVLGHPVGGEDVGGGVIYRCWADGDDLHPLAVVLAAEAQTEPMPTYFDGVARRRSRWWHASWSRLPSQRARSG